jgi:hypothetical protein
MRAQIVTLIDVGRQPQLKNLLLSGQMNTVVCQACGYVSMLAAPLVYHDASKQQFFVHFPQQLNARPEDQERLIGDATSMIMRGLPADTAKGYLLAPRRFLTINSLIETVLEGDGITKEMIESQRKRVELMGQLAEAYETGEEAFTALVAERKADLNVEFMATLAAFVEASARSQQTESAQILGTIYEELTALLGFDANANPDDLNEDEARTAALARLLEVDDADLEVAVAELRDQIDYTFFEEWTARIDAAEQNGNDAEAARLTERRATILELTEKIDRTAREMFEDGATLLRETLTAADPETILRANNEKINEAFLLVLDTNLATAERAGRPDLVDQLVDIRERALAIVEESLSPEDRLINQLLKQETQQDASALLNEYSTLVTTALVKRINEAAEQFEQAGRKPEGERLRQMAREASIMLF